MKKKIRNQTIRTARSGIITVRVKSGTPHLLLVTSTSGERWVPCRKASSRIAAPRQSSGAKEASERTAWGPDRFRTR